MKPLIVANWKCNPITLLEAKRLFNSVKKGIRNAWPGESPRVKVIIICPPFPFIFNLKSKSRGPSKMGGRGGGVVVLNLKLGGQDCFWEEKGAFTGEVSARMLKNLGCEYVILGHSERRRFFGEVDEVINKKVKAVLEAGLKAILCVGETEMEREKGETFKVVRKQIEKGLAGIGKKENKNLLLAYEPVWAIGNGNACHFTDAKIVAEFLTQILRSIFGQKIPILYGGSVDSQNARDYIKKAKMQGLLVGSTSLDAKEFVEIVKNTATI